MFIRKGPLFAPLEDGDGDNGGNGDDGQTSAGTDTPSGVSEDRVRQIVSEVANVAIGKRFREFESKQAKAQETLVASVVEKVGETLDSALGAKLDEMGVKPAQSGDSPKQSFSEEELKKSPLFRSLQKKLETTTSELENIRQQSAAEKKKARGATLRQKLVDALAANGIEGKRATHAANALLFEERVRYASDEDESIVFRDSDGGDIDLGIGVSDWAKSEDGKLYLPPRGASGSGGAANGGNGALKPKQTGNMTGDGEIGAALLSAARGAV